MRSTPRPSGVAFVVLAWVSLAVSAVSFVVLVLAPAHVSRRHVESVMAVTGAGAVVAVGLAVAGLAGMGRPGVARVLPGAVVALSLSVCTLGYIAVRLYVSRLKF